MTPLDYVTGDEVNAAFAQELVQGVAVDLRVRHWTEPLRTEAVVVCDWDSLPPEAQQQFYEMTIQRQPPAALHSYRFNDADDPSARALREAGFLLYGRLDRRVFAGLPTTKAA